MNSYLSEAGSRVFDAALNEYVEGYDEVGEVMRSDVFCTVSARISALSCVLCRAHQGVVQCLLNLGLGRNSVLFTYDREKGEFRPVRQRLRISGCTAGAVERYSSSQLHGVCCCLLMQ